SRLRRACPGRAAARRASTRGRGRAEFSGRSAAAGVAAMTLTRRAMPQPGFEEVVLGSDPESGYRGIAPIHDPTLGRSAGGARLWPYPTDQAALDDVLRLARTMTYKSAIAGMPLGGGKAVIIADPAAIDRQRLFLAHGRFVESFGGRYI